MASISSTNVNEFLPGLEEFLRTMTRSEYLDNNQRQIAAIYLDKLDQFSQLTNQQSSVIDEPSLMNTDMISYEESDDFTDEEEEEQRQSAIKAMTRTTSICDNQLYNSTNQESNISNSQWYIDLPKNDHLQSLTSQSSNENNEIIQKQSSVSSSSNILADGLLLTYDKNHNWIWRYYVLDNFDLICFPADKKSRSTIEGQSDKNCSPLWVSDMTNAKVHTTIIDKLECLCLQIGLAEALYVRPSDPNEIHIWLRAFREASSQKSKENSKSRTNVKTLSHNARRMFAQFNRKKGQLMSHILDQMANVTGVDDKTRKHYELRGFLVISFDNLTFSTKYCTIIEGIFRIHKSRLSEQTDYKIDLNFCTLSFPEERTRDIQFALIDQQNQKIFIRGNNIYTMGRLLNTLAKYVEIKGSSQTVFKTEKPKSETSVEKNFKSLPLKFTKNIYRSALQLHENIHPNQQEKNLSNEIYDQPKNNNQVEIQPRPRERIVTPSHQHSSPNILSINSIDSKSLQNYPRPLPRRSSIDCVNKFIKNSNNEQNISAQTYEQIPLSLHIQPPISKRVYDIPITIERPPKFIVPSFQKFEKSTSMIDQNEEKIYDNLSNTDGIGKFRFVIPFNHSPRSAFKTIKPINSPSSSSSPSSTISSNSTMPQSSSSSSDYTNTNNNNNHRHRRRRLMTAV